MFLESSLNRLTRNAEEISKELKISLFALFVSQPPPYPFHEFTLENINGVSGPRNLPDEEPIELTRPVCSSHLFPAFSYMVSALPSTCDGNHPTLHLSSNSVGDICSNKSVWGFYFPPARLAKGIGSAVG